MSLIKIVCANCGAQYRLPETFKADAAKCKKCGASIDVAAQRTPGSPAAPAAQAQAPKAKRAASAAAGAAAAAPTRSSRRSKSTGEGDAKPARRSSSRRASAGDEETKSSRRSSSGSRRARRGAGGDEDGGDKRKGNGVVVWGSIAALAVIVVVAVFLLQGDDEPTSGDTANANDNAAAAGESADDPQGTPGDEAPTADATGEGDKQATPADANPDEGAPADAADTKEPEKASADTDKETKPTKGKREIKSAEDVFDPMTELEALAWPDSVPEDDQALVSQLVDDIENGGTAGIKAKAAIANMGFNALVGVINKLREIDYTDPWESQTAYEYHKLLGDMTVGMNVGFKAVEADEEISLEKADWNARTAKSWQALLTRYPTKEAFDEFVQKRKAGTKKD